MERYLEVTLSPEDFTAMRFSYALVAALSLVATAAAHACSITYDAINSSNGVYRYNVVEPGSSGAVLTAGETFKFTGLDGVTSISTLYPSYFSTAFTNSTATFTLLTTLYVPQGTYQDAFTIISTDVKPGTVRYALTGTSVTGSVAGPVAGPVATAIASTPEPSSLALLGTGLLGAVGAVRRRLA